MTAEHILYIPTIFTLGLLAGMFLIPNTRSVSEESTVNQGVSPSVWPVIITFTLFSIVFAATHFFMIPRSVKAVTKALGGQELFDKKPSYTSEEVYARIGSFPAEGIALYKEFTYTMDVVFPSTLYIFLLSMIAFIIKRRKLKKWIVLLYAIPSLWFVFDMVENGIVYHLLSVLPTADWALAGILGYITVVKFTFLLFSLVFPVVLAIKRT